MALLIALAGCGDTDTKDLDGADAGCVPASCEAGEVCRDDGSCGPCTEDSQCGSGAVCAEGACTSGTRCESSSDCAEGEVCADGLCAAPTGCDDETPCPGGLVCSDEGVCGPCDSDWACGDGEICQDGACTEGQACELSEDCPEALRCSRGLCRAPCEDDASCGPPMGFFVCVQPEAECRQRCTASRQCPERHFCDANLCVPAECSTDEECGSAARCVGADEGRGRCEDIQVCQSNADCPNGQSCNPNTGECQTTEACRTDRDCGAGAYCDANGYCQFAQGCSEPEPCPEGFDCVAQLCVPGACRGDDDCPGTQQCVAGSCEDPSDPATVVEIRLLTPNTALRPGQTLQLTALGLDQAGRAVPALRFDWQSAAPAAVFAVDAQGRVTAGATPGSNEVTASVQGALGRVVSNPITLTNLGPAQTSSAGFSVRVTHRVTGQALAAVTVVDDRTGQSTTTDFAGIARLPTFAGTADFTVRHPDFDWVSVRGATLPDLGVSLAPVRRSTAAAGASGSLDLSQVQTSGALAVAVAGLSFPSPVFDFDASGLFGGDVHQVDIPMVGGVPVPASFTVGIEFQGTQFPLKNRWYAQSAAGIRAVWAFGGKVDLQGSGLGLGDLANIQAAILPFFQRFEHAVYPAQAVLAAATVPDQGDVDGDGDSSELRPDWSALPSRNLGPSVSQSLRYQLRVGALPRVEGGNANALIVLAGVRLPSVGFVPLGIDGQSDQMGSGIVPEFLTRMAPPHDGLEAGQYVVVATAVRLAGAQLPGPGSTRVYVGPRLPSQIDLGATWLDAPTGASWDASTRRITLAGPASGQLLRARFGGTEGGWEIYAPAGAMVEVPAATGATDRASGDLSLDAIELSAGTVASELFEASVEAPVGLDAHIVGYARARL